jgi:serine/threonine protein kinase
MQSCLIVIKCIVQVLGHVSQRIADLHKKGYVHRDLKPGNIMWQPRTYNWVLIDFGLVARIHESVSVGCTPGYAAPETALAKLQGRKKMVVDEKVDSWALGVIAYELLVEKSAFGMFQGIDDVCFLKLNVLCSLQLFLERNQACCKNVRHVEGRSQTTLWDGTMSPSQVQSVHSGPLTWLLLAPGCSLTAPTLYEHACRSSGS